MSADAPLFGLVLAGGASTRMQRDKAAIEYHGQSQLHWTFQLLSHVCAATFVSVRPDQREEPTRAGLPQIVDRQPGIGPIAGISAALHAHPKAAWLVVACDLPFLNEPTLRYLIEHRDPRRLATAFKSSHDGLPEPLCAIWEPASREPLLAFLAAGKQCPRKFLINADTLLLDLPDARALDNVNTSDEYRSAAAAFGGPLLPTHPPSSNQNGADRAPSPNQAGGVTHLAYSPDQPGGDTRLTSPAHSGSGASRAPSPSQHGGVTALASSPSQHGGATPLASSPSQAGGATPLASSPSQAGEVQKDNVAASGAKADKPRTLRVQYYAILREQAGRSEETLDTTATTPAELYDELRRRHPFQLNAAQLKVALNNDFSDWQTPLRHGDTVVFIPPVAGG
ncbi:NTP transferase domain-containing protein [Peristeroidobacter soli]|uniref:NTP transferase domain-containing protein n=1 Tax=Peristeroidobacter soli TaxID=2497877 RepID=UPI0013002064|nr:NTP transferase domain-containing protein [Peristeroidobacter soli]